MYIGASTNCKEYCLQQSKKQFDKYHSTHRHGIFDVQSFKKENKDFMRRSNRAWNRFRIQLQAFFKKLKEEIQFIENEAFKRLEYQQVKTAISTNDKALTGITIDVMQERYRNLTCQDIEDFMKLRKKQEHISSLNTEREEIDFRHDIVGQLKDCFKQVCEEIKPDKNNGERKEHRQRPHPRNYQTKRQQRPVQSKYVQDEVKPARIRRSGFPSEQYSETETNQSHKKTYYKGSQRVNNRRRDYMTREEDNQDHKEELNTWKNHDNRGNLADLSCPVKKIKELTAADKAVSIELKLINFIKDFHGRQMWRVSDQTGEAKLIIPQHGLLKEGALITVKNCYTKQFHGAIQISTKADSRIATKDGKQQTITFTHHYNRNNNKGPINKQLTKINDIDPESSSFKIIAKVISVKSMQNPKDTYMCVLGDETGIINSQFECKAYQTLLKEGSSLYFRNLNAKVDSQGHLFVTGTRILMEQAHDKVSSVKATNNVSVREYELIQLAAQK